MVSFKLFAKARELCNSSLVTFDIPFESTTLLICINYLQHTYPQLSTEFLNSCRFVKNKTYLELDSTIICNDTITVIPPVSGG